MGAYSIAAGGGLVKPRTVYPNMGLTSPYIYGALVPIASQTFNGSTAGATFTNIPQIYQDLMVVSFVRTTETVTETGLYAAVNSFTGTASHTWLAGNGSAALSGRGSNTQYAWLAQIPGASATSGIFSSVTTNILNYANSNTFKTFLTRSANDLNGSGSTALYCNLMQTTSAITSLSVVSNALNNYAAGSTVTLYGIRAANS
jgi:hypothetical protein